MEAEPKRRGRPPGSPNRPKVEVAPRELPPSSPPGEDFFHPDVDSMVSRQLALINWAQQALRNEMKRGMQASGERVLLDDVKKLVELSNALARTVESLKRTSDLAEEMASRMSPAQLLEAAIKKVEGQDLATIRSAIRRLRAHLASLAPVTSQEALAMGETKNAVGAIAALEDE